MPDIAEIQIRARSSDVDRADRSLDRLDRTAARTEKTTERLNRENDQAVKSYRALGGSMGGVRSAAIALGSALAAIGVSRFVSATIDATNEYASLQGQLKLVTGSQQELNAVYERSLALANATGQTTEATVNLYARLARSTEQLGLNQDQLFTITEAVNQSFIVSGASAQEAGAAMLQLSQGLASGAVQGEELRSVLENSPRLARALADGLGVARGELKKLGADSQLTADRITTALLNSADSIRKDFEQMPMTIGRAWQGVSNDIDDAIGRADTAPLIEDIQELQKAIGSPEFRTTVTDLSGALLRLTGAAANALTGMTSFANWIGQEFAAAIHGIAFDDLPRLEGELSDLQDELAFYEKNGHGAGEATKELRKQIEEMEKRVKLAREFQSDMAKATGDVEKSAKSATPDVNDLSGAMDDLSGNSDKAAKEMAKFEKEVGELLDELYPFEAQTREVFESFDMLQRAVRMNIAPAEALDRFWASNGLSQFDDRLQAARGSLQDSHLELERLAEQGDETSVLVTRGVERMRDGFGDFFQQILVDGQASFSDLIDLFKATVAEMIATAAANRVFFGLGITGASGSALAGGSATQNIGGALDLTSMASSAYSMFSNGIAGLGTTFSNTIGGTLFGAGQMTGLDFLTNAGTSAFETGAGFANGTLGAGTMALSAGAGLAGSYAGTQIGENLFGKNAESAWGATIGTAIGSAILPGIGSAIGGAIGGLADAAFGTGSGDPRKAYDLNFATGTRTNRSYTSGSEMDEAADTLADTLFAFAEQIGGSNAQFGVVAHSQDGYFFANEGNRTYGNDRDRFISDALDRIIEGATELDPVVQSLALSFEGAAADLAEFTVSMQGTHELLQNNPVEQAITDFASAQERAGMTLYDTYMAQMDAIREMRVGFDGSAAAASQLNAALAQNQQAAYQMAMGIETLRGQMDTMFASSAQSIRESVMSEEELFDMRMQERNQLRASLTSIMDVGQLQQTLQEINQLNNQLFQSFDNPGENRADVFAQYAERTAEIGEAQMDRILNRLENTQQQQMDAINRMMQDSAAQQQQAASEQVQASATMLEAANLIIQYARGATTEVV